MDYSKTPHACFKIDVGSMPSVDEEFPQKLMRHLQTRFEAVRSKKPLFAHSWAVEVLGHEDSTFTVLLTRSKYEKDEWVMLVGPSKLPRLLDLVRGQKPVEYSPELARICREIHGFLIATAGISAVRWYFEGLRSQATAVATPDELPWKQQK